MMAANLRFAAEVLAVAPKWYRYELIWEKSRAGGFLNARRRPLNAHEHILVFGGGQYRPQMTLGCQPIHANSGRRGTGANYGDAQGGKARAGATDRFPRSVLGFASVGTTAAHRIHPQQKPIALMRYLVRTYSRPGQIVADPFSGSGVVGAACGAESREFVGWEINAKVHARSKTNRWPG
jgi:site-specific DNA-methyltransferase (adenine-specific)